jgi:hypothetical protein
MKSLSRVLGIVGVVALILGTTAGIAGAATTRDYGDKTLSGGFQAGHLDDWWDLTQGDMTISFTYDANGLVDDFGGGAHAWAEIGVRSPCHGDFNPTWMVEGSGVWLATDYEWSANTFDPDPVGSPSLDLDDKLILQKGGGLGEGSYNLPSAPPNPWANHAVWFDRDGVDQWQAQMWGAIDGVTYNTGGTYDIVITLQHNSPTSGTAYMTINGEPQGFYDPGWHAGPADLMPAGMTFTGDMEHLRVFYGLYGYGATHTVAFNNITVEGVITDPPLAPCFQQAIDIKPGSYPNSINLESKGVVPVAILSSSTFDATTVDPLTVQLGSANVAVRGKGTTMAHEEDVNGDGLLDLVIQVNTADLGFAPDAGEAVLTGYTFGGQFFWGTDEINIVKAE